MDLLSTCQYLMLVPGMTVAYMLTVVFSHFKKLGWMMQMEVRFACMDDPAYPLKDHLLCPFGSANLTPDQRAFNKDTSSVRQCVEWGFGKVVQLFAFVDFKKILSCSCSLLTGMTFWPISSQTVTPVCVGLRHHLLRAEPPNNWKILILSCFFSNLTVKISSVRLSRSGVMEQQRGSDLTVKNSSVRLSSSGVME